MAQEIVVSGGSLLDLQGERPADLLIAEGCIADIGSPGAFFGRGIEVDASDALVMPGFVDIQVHFRTPGGEDSEDIASGAAGAALGARLQRIDAGGGVQRAERMVVEPPAIHGTATIARVEGARSVHTHGARAAPELPLAVPERTTKTRSIRIHM